MLAAGAAGPVGAPPHPPSRRSSVGASHRPAVPSAARLPPPAAAPVGAVVLIYIHTYIEVTFKCPSTFPSVARGRDEHLVHPPLSALFFFSFF